MENKYAENDFDLEENKDFEESAGKIRNVGHILLYAIIGCGLLGVFGYGIWTKKTKSVSKEFSVEYERFLHSKRETPLKILVANYKTDSTINVAINTEYFKKISLKSILPEPYLTVAGNEKIIFKFRSLKNCSGQISFNTFPSKPGGVDLNVLVNNEAVSINQLIYPDGNCNTWYNYLFRAFYSFPHKR
ncbi:MAG: hypothetical protein ACJ77K_06295 [Bacteroidia bacterium]|jgi:hypothetical protein